MTSIYKNLRQKIESREAIVGIIGLGYVGLPLGMAVVHAGGFKMIGFDIDQSRVDMLSSGDSDIGAVPSEILQESIALNKFEATTDFSRLAEADVILICVPTPLSINRVPDISYVMDTVRTISKTLRKGQMVILESTTYPKMTDTDITPLLEKTSGMTCGEGFFTAYSPEREDPGNQSYSTRQIPKVVGADDDQSLDLVTLFYDAFIVQTVPVANSATAEAVKLTENIFRSVNIALVNELKVVYDAMGINVWDVIEAASTKPFGFMPFYPGPGIGGHCIPLDPFYLTFKSHEFGRHTRFIELAGEINQNMPAYVMSRITSALNSIGKSVKNSKILVLGVAYKKHVGDVRESPALNILELLAESDADVCFHDPYVEKLPRMRHHPDLTGMTSEQLTDELIKSVDLAVVITGHDDVDYKSIAQQVPLFVDSRNVSKSFRHEMDNIFLT